MTWTTAPISMRLHEYDPTGDVVLYALWHESVVAALRAGQSAQDAIRTALTVTAAYEKAFVHE